MYATLRIEPPVPNRAADARLQHARRGLDVLRHVHVDASTAFGIGATSDANTVPSLLNRQGRSGSWINLSGRAYNSFQELLNFILIHPSRVRNVVIFSGVNDLYLAFIGQKTPSLTDAFFFQSSYEEKMSRPVGVKESLRSVVRAVDQKFSRKPPETHARDPHRAIANFRRNMEVWNDLRVAMGFRLFYALQPLATWIDKEHSAEEWELFEILDSVQDAQWQWFTREAIQLRPTYLAGITSVLTALDIEFMDFNECPEFHGPEWLFVDRIHLTDRGYQLVADTIGGWVVQHADA